MTEVKKALSERYGRATLFLGVNITQNQNGDVWIGQPVAILHKASWRNLE